MRCAFKNKIFLLFIMVPFLGFCGEEEKTLFSGKFIPFELETEIIKESGIQSYYSLCLVNHSTYQRSHDPSLWPSFIEEVFEIPLSHQEGLKFPKKYEGKTLQEKFLLMMKDLKSLYCFILGAPHTPSDTLLSSQEFHFFFLPSFKRLPQEEREKVLCLNFSNTHPLRWIPPSISLLSNLRYIDFSFTLIHSLPPCLWNLPKLEHFYLESTPLEDAGYPGGSWTNIHLPSLIAFGVNFLLLKDFPLFHHRLPELTHVYIPDPLRSFPDCFMRLEKSLEEREKKSLSLVSARGLRGQRLFSWLDF